MKQRVHDITIRVRFNRKITAAQARYAAWNNLQDHVWYGDGRDGREPYDEARVRVPRGAPKKRSDKMIRKFLDLSTAHISPDARKWLESHCWLVTTGDATARGGMAALRDGYFIHVPYDVATDGPTHPDLRPIMEVARFHGADYVLFDNDAEIMPGLTTYQEPEGGDEGFTDEEKAAMRGLHDRMQSSGPPEETDLEPHAVRMARIEGGE